MTAAGSKYTATSPFMRNESGKRLGSDRRNDAVRVRGADAERDQREHVQVATHDRCPAATKNGHPPQSTTGVASASSIQFIAPCGTARWSG